MGQCGCADFCGEFTLPAPDGGMYVFGRYAPCEGCGTPAGIVVYKFGMDEIEMWHARDLPQLNIDVERLIPVLSVESLAAETKHEKLEILYEDGDGYDNVGDYLLDDGYQMIGQAMSHPKGDWADWKP